MRRIRHVVLPVRSWHYIGLLIVSLACLTLGLVSRDREGHAGSLAGPELIHRAPHEADSCPNLNPFTKMSLTNVEPGKTLKPVNEIELSESRVSPTSRRTMFSRSMSLDRSSRLGSRLTRQFSGNQDSPQTEKISRSRIRVSDRLREYRSRDVRSLYDPTTRLSRSRDLSNRATDRRSVVENRALHSERRSADRQTPRLDNRRSLRAAERPKLNEIAQNRLDRSNNFQRRADNSHDQKSLSMERRILSGANRQESRSVDSLREYQDSTRNRVGRRSEMRRSRFAEQRAIERRERSSRREDRMTLSNRLPARIISREGINRNNNLDQTRERSLENRRALLIRVANVRRERTSAVEDLAISHRDRRSLSRSFERLDANAREQSTTLRRQVRSVDIARSNERRSLARSIERRKLERDLGPANSRSLNDRATSQVSLDENSSRERISRDSRENVAMRGNSRSAFSRSRRNLEENANPERRRARFSRPVDRNSMERRPSRSSRIIPVAERRGLTLARRERTSRLYQLSSEELGRSRETEPSNPSGRVTGRRVLDERRAVADSARLESRSEKRTIDDPSRSGEGSRTRDRRSNSRVHREKMTERRSARDSRKSTDRRIQDRSARMRESEVQSRRVERNSELHDSIAMRRMERAVPNSRAHLASRTLSRLSDVRNLRDTRAQRNMEVRKIIPRTIEHDYGLYKYPVTYDLLRQAFLVALCTVYGLSLCGKKSAVGNNIMQQAQRFLVW